MHFNLRIIIMRRISWVECKLVAQLLNSKEEIYLSLPSIKLWTRIQLWKVLPPPAAGGIVLRSGFPRLILPVKGCPCILGGKHFIICFLKFLKIAYFQRKKTIKIRKFLFFYSFAGYCRLILKLTYFHRKMRKMNIKNSIVF